MKPTIALLLFVSCTCEPDPIAVEYVNANRSIDAYAVSAVERDPDFKEHPEKKQAILDKIAAQREYEKTVLGMATTVEGTR